MKNALKIAMPTILAIVLAWVAIEGIKYARGKWQAEQDAKKFREQQAAMAAAALAAERE